MIKQYMQDLQKEEYRFARRNYTNKCIELEVKYHTKYIYIDIMYMYYANV